MKQFSSFLSEKDAGHDGSARATKTPAERDRVLDVDVRLDGERALVVASQDVEGDARDEVALRVEADVARVLALALVCDSAVERVLRGRLGAVDGDVQLEVDGQRQANDVEAGANVGAGAGRLDHE